MKARTWDTLQAEARKLDIVQRTEFLKHLAVNLTLIDSEEDGDAMREAWQQAIETARGELLLMPWSEIWNTVCGMDSPRRVQLLDFILSKLKDRGGLPGLTPEERHADNAARELLEDGLTHTEGIEK